MPPNTCIAPCATSRAPRDTYALAIDAVRRGLLGALVERRRRVAAPQTSHRLPDIHVREHVAQRLKAADRAAELPPLHGVAAGLVEDPARRADRLGGGEQ